MEFTKLFKYVSASLFLVLLAHGLFLGFSIPTTIISIVLLLVCFLMEQKLVLHEREELNTKIHEILTSHNYEVANLIAGHEILVKELHTEYKKNQEDIMKKIEVTHSQINILKTAQGVTTIRRS